VLAWLAKGHPGKPTGQERKRLSALQEQYAKKAFLGTEAAALKALAVEWAQDPDPTAKEAAAQFEKMLAGQRTELSEKAKALCAKRADEWEGRYRDGMIYVAGASRDMAAEIVRTGAFLDHPHIYQYVSLLEHRFDGVRREVAEGVWLMRHDRFTVRFLAESVRKTAINPFLAVPTQRLTREEREREMKRANERRMKEVVRLMGQLGVDYIEHPDDYKDMDKDPDEYVRKFIIGALLEVSDEPAISELVKEALTEMRQADQAQPRGPRLFTSRAEQGALTLR